ncbi:MAG TPA: murein L,D-transpeptidase catalytic domain family protein [Gemmatimonadales bacterium]
MPRLRFLPLIGLLLAGAACARPRAELAAGAEPAYPRPLEIPAEAWTHASAAYQHALIRGVVTRPRLTVIDYSLPSNVRRLWVVDMATGEVLMNEYVAHAIRSGGTWATSFSNRDGSRRTSLGTFVTGGTFSGVRGLALHLRGLEPGINDHASQRGIVIHGTPGVSAARARLGRMGRTEGCPAVPRESARRLIGLINEGSIVFAWYPDRNFLTQSEYVDRYALTVRLAGSD